MPKGQVFTYQTRIPSHPALDAYADLYGRVERKLFAEIRAGRPPEDLKSSYLELFRIPARLFDSARISALGKISSAQECQALNIQDLTVRTKSLEKKLAKIKDPFNKHQKARRLGILKGRLERLILDQASAPAESASLSAPRSSGGPSRTLRATATPPTKSGWKSGARPAAPSFS